MVPPAPPCDTTRSTCSSTRDCGRYSNAHTLAGTPASDSSAFGPVVITTVAKCGAIACASCDNRSGVLNTGTVPSVKYEAGLGKSGLHPGGAYAGPSKVDGR